MASSKSMGQFAPRTSGVRDPRDTGKKNGMFHNPPRFQYFGGGNTGYSQAGTRKPRAIGAAGDGQNANGPISDRGKGRG